MKKLSIELWEYHVIKSEIWVFVYITACPNGMTGNGQWCEYVDQENE